jgi:hypothetical protein
MRRIRALVLVAFFLVLAGALFAEYQVIGKDAYVVNRPIVKVFAHKLGYKIIFLKENSGFGVVYVPLTWVYKAGGMAEIVWGTDPAYPSFSAFYVDGKFNHIRLYFLRDLNDPVWAVLVPAAGEEQKFSVDTLQITY